MQDRLFALLSLLIAAGAAFGCDQPRDPEAPPSPAELTAAPRPDHLRDPVANERRDQCDNGRFVGPPHFADIPPATVRTDVGIAGTHHPEAMSDHLEKVRREADEAAAQAPAFVATATAAVPPRLDPAVATRLSAYQAELARRADELAALDDATREQRKAEIKRRLFGE